MTNYKYYSDVTVQYVHIVYNVLYYGDMTQAGGGTHSYGEVEKANQETVNLGLGVLRSPLFASAQKRGVLGWL